MPGSSTVPSPQTRDEHVRYASDPGITPDMAAACLTSHDDDCLKALALNPTLALIALEEPEWVGRTNLWDLMRVYYRLDFDLPRLIWNSIAHSVHLYYIKSQESESYSLKSHAGALKASTGLCWFLRDVTQYREKAARWFQYMPESYMEVGFELFYLLLSGSDRPAWRVEVGDDCELVLLKD